VHPDGLERNEMRRLLRRWESDLLTNSHEQQRLEDAQQMREHRRNTELRKQMQLVEEYRRADEVERALQTGYAAGLLAMSPYSRSSGAGSGVPGPVVVTAHYRSR